MRAESALGLRASRRDWRGIKTTLAVSLIAPALVFGLLRGKDDIEFLFKRPQFETEAAEKAKIAPGEPVYFDWNTGMPASSVLMVYVYDDGAALKKAVDDHGSPCWYRHMGGRFFLFDAGQCGEGAAPRLSR